MNEPQAETYLMPEHGWTCFHCGETFMSPASARDHFGADPSAMPGCLMRIQPGERPLMRRLRWLEGEVERLQAEAESEYAERYHARLASDIKGTALAFRDCNSLRDVFNLYDSVEGRALVAELRASLLWTMVIGHPMHHPSHHCSACDGLRLRLEGQT